MFVVVDRKAKIVRVSGLTVNEAGWLGYYFVKNFPDLARPSSLRGWCVVSFDDIPAWYDRRETYDVKAAWGSAASKVAGIINTPAPPVHPCPDCKCGPECCK